MNKTENIQEYSELLKKLMAMDNMENFSAFHNDSSWVAQRSYYFSTFLKLPLMGDNFSDFVIFDFTGFDGQGTILISSGEGELLDSVTSKKSLNEAIDQYENKKVVFEYCSKPEIPRYNLSEKNMKYLVDNPHDFKFHDLVSKYSSLRDSVLNNLNYLTSQNTIMKQKFAHSVVHRVPLFYKDKIGDYVLRSTPVNHGATLDDVNVSIPAVPFGQVISGKRELTSYDLLVGKGQDFNEAYINLADKIIETYGLEFDTWKGFA